MIYATINVKIPGSFTLDQRDDLVEKVRETAFPMLSSDGRKLTIKWEADELGVDCGWILRGYAQDTIHELASNFEFHDLDLVLDNAEIWIE